MFRNMTLSTKILSLVGVFILMSIIIALIGWQGMHSTVDRFDKSGAISNLIRDLLQARRHEKNFIIRGEQQWIDLVFKHINEMKKEINDNKNKFKDPRNQRHLEEALAAIGGYEKSIIKLGEYQRTKSAVDKKEEHDKELEEIDKELLVTGRKVGKSFTELLEDQKAKVQAQISRTNKLIIGVPLITMLFGLLIGLLFARSITKPINRVTSGLANGAEQIASASGQVSSASQQLAEGSSSQAAAIEETSSSLEEMASMTRQNADNAHKAKLLMDDTAKVVDQANLSMNKLTQSMKEITGANEETAKIIKAIDEIAFQTNLLALNAAVEAARAGEAGAGFAVVADEVRSLAMRSAEAARNTANLIDATVTKVHDGSNIVTHASGVFSKVSVSVNEVKDLVAEIAAASHEQAKGVEQINKAVAEMDKVVQQNAANAEQSASAAAALTSQTVRLRTSMAELESVIGGRRADRQGFLISPHLAKSPATRSGALHPALPDPLRTANQQTRAGQDFQDF